MDSVADGTDGGLLDQVEYIERMTHELSRLAAAAQFPLLAYLLTMAREEAAANRASLRIRLSPEEVPGRTPRRLAP